MSAVVEMKGLKFDSTTKFLRAFVVPEKSGFKTPSHKMVCFKF